MTKSYCALVVTKTWDEDLKTTLRISLIASSYKAWLAQSQYLNGCLADSIAAVTGNMTKGTTQTPQNCSLTN